MAIREYILHPGESDRETERHALLNELRLETLFAGMAHVDTSLVITAEHERFVARLNEITRDGVASGELPSDTREWKDEVWQES